jgi:hypothetical protein
MAAIARTQRALLHAEAEHLDHWTLVGYTLSTETRRSYDMMAKAFKQLSASRRPDFAELKPRSR